MLINVELPQGKRGVCGEWTFPQTAVTACSGDFSSSARLPLRHAMAICNGTWQRGLSKQGFARSSVSLDVSGYTRTAMCMLDF
jgi:hypothetical protein